MRSREVSLYLLAHAAPAVVWLVMIPVWLSTMGAAAYGRFAVCWVIAVLSAAVGTGWIRQAALRDVGDDRVSLRDLPPRVLGAGVGLPGLVSAVGWSASPGSAWSDAVLACLFATSLATVSLVQVTFQCRQRAGAYCGFEVSRCLLAVVLAALAFAAGLRGDQALLAGTALGNAVACLSVRSMVLPQQQHTPSWSIAGKWWSYGWPMSVWLGFAPLVLFTDRLVLGLVSPAAEVGNYAAVSEFLVRGAGLVGLSVNLSLHPRIMRAANASDRAEVAREIRHWSFLVSGAFVVVILVALQLGESLAARLTGGAGVETSVIVLLLLGGGLWQVSLIAHKPLEVAGATRRMLGMLMIAWLVEVLVCVSLVSRYSSTGAALSVAVGAAMYCGQVAIWRVRHRVIL